MRKKIILPLVTAALLSITLTSCGTSGNPAPASSAPAATTSTSSQPSATATVAPATPSATATKPTLSTAAAQQGAAKAISDFYNGTFKLPHATIVAAQKVNDAHSDYSASEYSEKIEALVPSLKLIDKTGTTPERVAAFEYGYTGSVLAIADSLQTSGSTDFKFVIDGSQIDLSDNNTVGEVPAKAVAVELNGEKQSNTTSTGIINMVYVNGKWYIDASKN